MPEPRAILAMALLILHYSLVASVCVVSPLSARRCSTLASRLQATSAAKSVGSSSSSSIQQDESVQSASRLITDSIECRMLVRSDRYVIPGDYILHEEYGVGRYKGQHLVDLTPTRQSRQMQLAVVVQFADAELVSFKKMASKEYWVYREGDSGEHELSSVINTRKWKKRKRSAEDNCKSMALNLLSMLAIRNGNHRTPCLPLSAQYREFERRFPYEPTVDQQACFQAIEGDMIMSTRPMERLICGDVGFGKTEVAMRAIYMAVLSERQVALLAPTRILALQHLRVLRNRMPDVNVQLLRGGSGSRKDMQAVKEQIESNECKVIVGTHALLQPNITFANLGLIVIDEEQRFGVAQKEKLKVVQSGIDVLTLSATPIPRTLQLSVSGIRDFSQMVSPPRGRKEVLVTVGIIERSSVVSAIEREVLRGGQVFVVVPFIRDVHPTRMQLKSWMPSLRFLDAHGEHADLEERIDAFTKGNYDVLIATTVIENGIDMPNVNTIVVYEADRFGMSTLYQLRGRVGRSTTQAYACFLTNRTTITLEAETRLTYLKTFTALGSGYDLSRRDMEMRGYGSLFGADQSGSQDVGLDFQAQILSQAVKKLKEEYVLACADCHMELNTSMERWGVARLGAVPQAEDWSALCRWETALQQEIINKFLPEANNSGTSSTSGSSNFVFANGIAGWNADKEMLHRRLLAAGSISALARLSREWGLAGTYHPAIIELAKRSLVRVACRSLGISRATSTADGRGGIVIEMISGSINRHKFDTILEPAIPEDLRQHVSYTSDNATACGTLTFKSVGDGGAAAGGGLIAPELLALLVPLARRADLAISGALRSTDVSEVRVRKKKKAREAKGGTAAPATAAAQMY